MDGVRVRGESGEEEVVSERYVDNIALVSQKHNFVIQKNGGPYILG